MMILIVIAVLLLPLTLIWWRETSRMSSRRPSRRRLRRVIAGHILVFLSLYAGVFLWAMSTVRGGELQEPVSGEQPQQAVRGLSLGDGLAMMGIAFSTGLSVLGAGYAVALVGSAALG